MRETILVALTLLLASCVGGPGPGERGDAPPLQAISEIQGAGHVSPLLGRAVRAVGVVTAVPEGGFYLQDSRGDGDPATSDAVFVRTPTAAPVSVGDSVEVTGEVEELVPGGAESGNLGITRLVASAHRVLAGGAALPPPIILGSDGRVPPGVEVIEPDELPVDLRNPEEAAVNEFDPESEGMDFWESLEGMRVRVPEPVAVGPVRRFGDRVGELWVLSERGALVVPEDARTFRGGILLQPHPENRGDQNPERIQLQYDAGLTGAPVPSLATGATLGDATGVVSYGFGSYEILLTEAPGVVSDPSEPETTALVGGRGLLTVASYNVENLNPLPETTERMATLGAHIARRLGGPDIVALQEIQDAGGTRGGPEDPETDATVTLHALVRAVRAAGGPAYRFFDVEPEANSGGGAPGGNIRNAFLYDPRRVEIMDYRALTPRALEDAGARDPEAFVGSRAPLVARFLFAGRTLTLINNHLTSRFGSTPVFGAVQPFVQAGEEARAAQARALHDAVASLLSADPDAAAIVLGDMNTFEWSDDLDRHLAGEGPDRILHNLVLEVPANERYSYIFEGNSQQLDHVFVTDALREGAELDIVHVNADYPEEEPFRASDHEPLVARIRIR